MSEESLNRKDDLNRNVRNAGDHMMEKLIESDNKIKSGVKAMGNKTDDPYKDMDAEYNKEKLNEEQKDLIE